MRINSFGTFLEGDRGDAAPNTDARVTLLEQASRDPNVAAMLAAYEAVSQYLEVAASDAPPQVSYATGGNADLG
jgi:hypothetical protein